MTAPGGREHVTCVTCPARIPVFERYQVAIGRLTLAPLCRTCFERATDRKPS